ncbi:phosphate/phosphite/phosphonate ABC transporter substrate-binding protein [Pseudalkalibacillus berkeleyi]|uniref:Phosphate/phosphite/phosphonate ABC transporter substrate-binding protein n=1 Tax=Pseudalkalibacillus berkeleyi TaxID=1069813 RepID=A0ABS9H0Q8_9BACL|nr:phosphate/phosphite/phosphonate ABC transporter substrate-binding protein [Pseudalkalibacillus berkeleyi]MCF6137230.1 phosphate/phosphite/phosphonate ABC transporter substrate-binding protein [Pseudalkalibacillus berkeleyi]
MKKVLSLMIMMLVILAACGGQEDSKDSGSEGKEKKELTIGVIPAQTEGEMQSAMEKLEGLLEEKMDRKVKIDTYPDYNGVVEAMNFKKIDMAFFGPLTYVIANNKSGADAIITQLVDGEPFYHSYIITHKDNKFSSLEEFLNDSQEYNFAFGDPNSTSGSLIPSIELGDRDVFTDKDNHEFKTVRYTGSHDATALAVQNKQVDAGAIDSAIYDQLIESGKIDESKLKVIWKSDKLFQYPWAVNKEMDKDTKKQLQEIFVNIEDQDILDAFGASGFTKASNEDYESIKKAAIKQGVIKE